MLHIEVAERDMPGGTKREVSLKNEDGGVEGRCIYEISGNIPAPEVMDGYILGILFLCMGLGKPVRVHGDISDSFAYNMDDFQRAWERWCGGQYKRVDIIPDNFRRIEPARSGAIQAFSGGVDANFALVNNYIRRGKGGIDIDAALLVHGFDVDFDDRETFARLRDQYARQLDQYGVKLETIRTDSKIACTQNWDFSTGAQLAACLHNYSAVYGRGVIGSSEPYEALVIPWGSSPITDHLLSGDRMSIIHDGAGYSRTEKVAFLNEHSKDLGYLRVCWAGARQDRNCGKCEKCLRTRMNFAAVGNRSPECFDEPFADEMLKGFRPDIPLHLKEVEGVIRYLNRHGDQNGLKTRLRKALVMGYAYLAFKTTVRKTFSRSQINAVKKMLGKK